MRSLPVLALDLLHVSSQPVLMNCAGLGMSFLLSCSQYTTMLQVEVEWGLAEQAKAAGLG